MAVTIIPSEPVEIEVKYKGKTINIFKMSPHTLYEFLNGGRGMEDSARLSNYFVRIMTPAVEEIARHIEVKK